MANDDQEQSDIQTETVADQSDAANSQNGTSSMDDYQAEVAALMREDESGGHGEQPDHEEREESQETAEESEESEEQEQISNEEESEPEATGSKDSMRPRLKDPLDIAVAQLAKAKGISLIEAARIIDSAQATPTQQSSQTQEQSRDQVETVASVQARLEELEDLEAQASNELEFETANAHRKEANKLRNRLMDLKIAEVQERSMNEANEERKFYADYAANEAETVKYYPDAAKPGTPLYKEIARLDAQMLELGDPLYYTTSKPFALAKLAAKNLGIPMANPKRPPVQKSVQNRPIQPASGNARTTATDPSRRAAEAIDGLSSMRDYQEMVASLR